MSKAKDLFFALRDRVRFIWARNKFTFMPFGKVEDFDLKQMRHIVILKVDGKLGDTQVMTHFYQTLREQIPDLTLSVVCPPALAPIYADVLGFDQVCTSSRKPRKSEIEYICQKLTGPESACQYVDLVVTTEPIFKPRDFIFNYNLRPRYVAGCAPVLKGSEINLFLFDPYKDMRHITTCFTDFMQQGKLPFKPVHYVPLYSPEKLAEAKTSPGLIPTEGQAIHSEAPVVVGINPCGASVRNRVTPAMVSTLVKQLQAKWGAHVATGQEGQGSAQRLILLLLCPASLQDFVDEVKAQVGSVETKNFELRTLPPVDVESFAAYIGALQALVTVDTATVHLACASDVPQLCFYRGEDNSMETQRWCPYSDVAEVISSNTDRLDIMDSELFVSRSMSFLSRVLALD